MAHFPGRVLSLAALVLLTGRSLQADGPEAVSLRAAEINTLIDQLGAHRFLARQDASQRLTVIGRRALPALKDASHSLDAEVATRAQRIIADIQTSVAFLVEALNDDDAQQRIQAAVGLERLGAAAQDALPALLPVLKDRDETVRDAAIGAVLAIDPFNRDVADLVPSKAHADGKYRRLQRRIKVPEDRQSYSDFRDYGYYQACDWAGHTNLPAGYWVYVYPHWYIWREEAKDQSGG